eukprot:CAMPEP_0179156262 /NCGR_PEP_ID=MMETSP0796-20121207/76171_1 /TAXON_ID=73915 /ORGANISM="Pyrodinium bahamense, Strain pbaha01" /LENGTH=306 /DNA_ID=CAMNT_0020857831 /DNA_START=135 /DNA_END=1057 /DNA_ORIENTATION=+
MGFRPPDPAIRRQDAAVPPLRRRLQLPLAARGGQLPPHALLGPRAHPGPLGRFRGEHGAPAERPALGLAARPRDRLQEVQRATTPRASAPLLYLQGLRAPHGPPLPMDGELCGFQELQVFPPPRDLRMPRELLRPCHGTARAALLCDGAALGATVAGKAPWRYSAGTLEGGLFLGFGVVSLGVFLSLCKMLSAHLPLACRNLTSIEELYDNMENPYDHGDWVKNLSQILGGPGLDWLLPVVPWSPQSDGVSFAKADKVPGSSSSSSGGESADEDSVASTPPPQQARWGLRYGVALDAASGPAAAAP